MAHSKDRGIFARAMDSIIEARSRQAARFANGALLMLDDETLKSHGYDRKQLIKRGAVAYYI